MAETGIRLRLIIIVFTLSCLSVGFSTVLLLSHFWARPVLPNVEIKNDPFNSIDSDIAVGKSILAWDKLAELSKRKNVSFGSRGISLLWKTWKLESRNSELRDIARRIFENSSNDQERALICYLFLETGQGDALPSLSKQGYWTSIFPKLEAEIALYRNNYTNPRFSELDRGSFTDDTRLELDRAYAWGYLGDFAAARIAATRIIEMTVAPGQNGSTGIIDVNRGICRRQVARMIQIMSIWDSADSHFESLMHAALVELMVDPFGLIKVAPLYFNILCDSAAWTGDRTRLERLFNVANSEKFTLSNEQRENQSILSHDPSSRPETHADLRRILVATQAGDPRGRIPELNEVAIIHDDQRSWRLVAWYLLKTGDDDALARLLSKSLIQQGAWHALYDAISAEKTGDLELAFKGYQKARQGTLDNTALLNQARLLLRQGRIENAATLAAAARQGIEIRSIGLAQETGSAYAFLYADALALQARILRAQGRESEAQSILRLVYKANPNHPELFNATDLQIKPETSMEIHQ